MGILIPERKTGIMTSIITWALAFFFLVILSFTIPNIDKFTNEILLFSILGIFTIVGALLILVINPRISKKLDKLKRKELLALTILLDEKSTKAKTLISNSNNSEKNMPKITKLVRELHTEFIFQEEFFGNLDTKRAGFVSILIFLFSFIILLLQIALSSVALKILTISLLFLGLYYTFKLVIFWIIIEVTQVNS